ncbi:MAG: carbohydrate kinase [Pelagibacterium sp. SCN 63-23]|nr:MAG: carbohydrate kinase [Pelagibacterium sp. SCN 63-23]
MACVIGIDGGTESIRVHIFDLDGNCLGSSAAAYPTRFPQPGWAEQSPEDWWNALGTAMHAAMAEAEVDPRSVSALSLATTSCTVVMLDSAGQPIAPALLWMDVRASREAEVVRQARDGLGPSARNIHGPVSAEWMLPKALWLRQHWSQAFRHCHTLCEYQDYMVHRLTGRMVASLNTASIRWHYDIETGGAPRDMLQALDFSDLLDLWPREVLRPGEPVGRLTAAAAAFLGLAPDVLVVQGGADAFVGMIGAGVNQPGQVALISGSSHLQLAVSDKRMNIPGLWGSYAEAVYPGRHIVEGGQSASGSMVAWLSRLIGCAQDLDRLNREAALLPPGSDGLVVLDHFQGGRSPNTDAASRGAIVGLSLAHTQAHLFRAAIEAVCLGTEAVLDTMRHGLPVSSLTVVGGATRSPLWLQIHADVAGLPIRVPAITEGPGIGAAILAATGAGHFDDIDAGIARMVRIARTIEPDPGHHATYQKLFADYFSLYPALRAWRLERKSA